VPDVCDRCGGPLVQRPDDAEATVAERLRVYDRETAPLVTWYRDRGLLVEVAGDGAVETVTERIVAALGGRVHD
jgi:adenylate kinase